MNKNKQLIAIINICLFFITIFVIATLNSLSPKDNTISIVENRTLMGKPNLNFDSVLSGNYSRDFENYFADNFIVRENLVKVSKSISLIKGIKRKEDVVLVDFEGQNVGGNDYDNENTENAENEVNTKGNLLILNDTVMEIYKFNENKSKLYANMINQVQEKMGDDIEIYSLLAPVQIEFLKQEKYKNLSDSQYDAIQFVNSNFSNKIKAIDAYNPIKEHIDEYVYFRTDHHWTALGAYYGYTGFIKSLGLETIALDDYSKGEALGFLGHLSTINPSETVNNNPDNIIYYNPIVRNTLEVYYYDKETKEQKTYQGAVISKSYIDKDQKYGIFLGGDFPLGVIKTSVNTDKKIMVIKDSYGNAFIPFLLNHYSEIYVIDPRHYKENIVELANENNIQEVLFLNYVLTTNFESYINSVLELTK